MTRKVEGLPVEAAPLDRLHPAPWNPRTIKDERFQNLVRSIQADPDFLWRRPILATADGTIYAGNMRYRAAQHLRMESVPAIIEDISEQLAKERALRDNIAEARGIEVSAGVIGKLLLLEDRYRDDFDTLAATPEGERAELLAKWEAWALGAENAGDCPAGISEATRVWAGSEPHLAGVALGPYITLAATLVSASLGGDLSDELAALVARLLGPSQADRGLAHVALAKRSVSDRRRCVAALLGRARRLTDLTDVVDALIGIAQTADELVDDVAQGIEQDCWSRLEPSSVAALSSSNVAPLVALVPRIAADDHLEADVRQAARQILEV